MSKQIKMKDLVTEGRSIQENFKRLIGEASQDDYLDTAIDNFIEMILSKKYNKDTYTRGLEAINQKFRSLQNTPEYKKFLVLVRQFEGERSSGLARNIVSAFEKITNK